MSQTVYSWKHNESNKAKSLQTSSSLIHSTLILDFLQTVLNTSVIDQSKCYDKDDSKPQEWYWGQLDRTMQPKKILQYISPQTVDTVTKKLFILM